MKVLFDEDVPGKLARFLSQHEIHTVVSMQWGSIKNGALLTLIERLKTEVKGFWTDTDLHLLFVCPYETLNIFLPADNSKPRRKLWDRDVVEIFLGDDWDNIRHYREYEIAPTGDWIDLAIDLDKKGAGCGWRSGWKTSARIDEAAQARAGV